MNINQISQSNLCRWCVLICWADDRWHNFKQENQSKVALNGWSLSKCFPTICTPKKKDAKWQTDVIYIQMWPPPHCWYSVQSFSVMHHVGFSLTASVFTTEHLLNQQRRIEWAFSPHPRCYGALMSNTLDEKYTLSTLASVAQGLLGHDIYYAPSRGVGVAFPAGPHTALLTFENSAWNTAVI